MNKLVSESSNVSGTVLYDVVDDTRLCVRLHFVNCNQTLFSVVVTIPMRSEIKIYATLQITFKDDLSYLVKFCNDDRSWVHTIFIRFQVFQPKTNACFGANYD